MLPLVLVTNVSHQTISRPNPFNTSEYIEVDPGQRFLAPASISAALEEEGFLVEPISVADLQKILKGFTSHRHEKRPIRSILKSQPRLVVLAVITQNYPKFAGLLIHFEQILAALTRCGCHVHLLARPGVELPYGDFPHSFERSGRLISEFGGFDLILSTADGDLRAALTLKNELEVPLGVFLPDPPWLVREFVEEFKLYYPERLDQELSGADFFIVACDFVRRSVEEKMGKPCLTFPPKLDIEPLKRPKRRRIVLCGRGKSYKGISAVLEELARRKDFDGEVCVIGNVPVPDALQGTVQVYAGLDRFEKSRILAESKVGIVFSKWEGYGLVAGEMRALGLHVVSNDIPSHREIWGDELHYVKSVAEAVDKAIELLDAEEAARMPFPSIDHDALAEQVVKGATGRFSFKSKVAIVTAYWDPPIGGGEITVKEIAEALVREGAKVKIFFTKRPKEVKMKMPHSIPAEYCPSEAALVRAVSSFSPDFVLGCSSALSSAKRVSQRLHLPLAMYLQFWHFLMPPYEHLDVREFTEEDRHAAGLLDGVRVFANSPYVAKVLKRLGVKAEVFVPKVSVSSPDGKPFSQRQGVVMSILENTPWARETITAIARAFPEIEFIIGHSRGDFSPPPNVKILDFSPDFKGMLGKARLALLLSSVDHTFCRFAIEVAAAGLPMVASARGNLRNFAHVRLVHSNSSEEFINAIRDLYFDFHQWDAFAKRCAAVVAEYSRLPSADALAKAILEGSKSVFRGDIVCVSLDFPGARRHLEVAARALGLPYFRFRQGLEFDCPVLVAGWSTAYLDIKAPEIWVLFCSSPAQVSFDTHERNFFASFLRKAGKGKIRRVFVATPGFHSVLEECGVEVKWLPHIVAVPRNIDVKEPFESSAGLFNLTSPRKNLITQALACFAAGLEVYCHEASASLLRDLPFGKVHAIPWLSDDAFFDLLSRMAVNLQVTVGESFNFLAVEALLRGVPCVMSPFPASKLLPEAYRSDFVVDWPDDIVEIRIRAENLARDFSNLETRQSLANDMMEAVTEHNAWAVERWREELGLRR